jgi:membrane-associated phospholipid phosphatase
VRSVRIQLAVCIGLGVLVRIAAFDIGPIQRLDVALLGHLSYPPWSLWRILKVIITPFDPLPYLALVAVVLAAAVLNGRRLEGLLGVATMAGASITTQLLKVVLAEHRPNAPDVHLPSNSWPSGHTTAAAALGVAIVLITPPGHRRAVAVVCAAGALAVGSVLVLIGAHYPSDIAGGLCVAGAWGAIAFAVSRRARPAVP